MRALAIAVLFGFGGAALAADKKPEGTWTKKADGFDLKFTFKKGDVVVFNMSNGDEKCELEAKYTFEKDGVVKCKTTKYTKNGNFPEVKEGDEFSFKLKIDGKKAKLSDMESKDITIDEGGKALVSGEYEKAAD